MRLALDPRARRLLRRLPRTTIFSVLELILLSLLAMQCARLVWTLVTPLGPVGDWKTEAALRPAQPSASALLGSFDPFFRAGASTAAAPAVVTSLNLKLFGVREDRASGRGSAIIGVGEGQQRSFLVGEEIMPGVTLTAVSFDSVTVSRAGATEQLFLDQSPPATTVGPGVTTPLGTPMSTSTTISPPPPLPVVVAPPPPPPALSTTSSPNPPPNGGETLRAAGMQPGDIITRVSGQPVRSQQEARSMLELGAQLKGVDTIVEVERGGRTVPIRLRTPQ
ncbi:MAG TPA: type II secretion system protein N [Allosphingosinicella sp.]|jgi:general secretion pathway protein C|uniref:type II secretion system protein N n=1 Tax=Allosphingosinicella sp. TaxID=2823234 RepID=UPI002F288D94